MGLHQRVGERRDDIGRGATRGGGAGRDAEALRIAAEAIVCIGLVALFWAGLVIR